MKKIIIFYLSILMLTFISCTNQESIANSDIEYLDDLNQSLQTIITNISDLNDFTQSSNLDDDTWINDFNTKINDISSSINQLTNITFPEDETDLKKSYSTILLNLNSGLDNFKLSCKTKNIDDFNKGVKYINTSIENIKTIEDKLN